MTLADDVNLEEFVMTKDEFSGADIKAICTEAGLLALRERRMKVRSYFYIFSTIFAQNTDSLEIFVVTLLLFGVMKLVVLIHEELILWPKFIYYTKIIK
jgi:SpoVK/Ycf46/Vps4 family AAA+-type ATPase